MIPVFNNPVSNLIRKRYSCRTYSPEPDADAFRELSRDAAALRRGLLGERARFSLVEIPEVRGARFSDYGLIAGARYFLLGAISRSERFRESYAFLLEHLVLRAADLGLDSCWVGYYRAEYFKDFGLDDGEERPAVVVVGRGAERPRFRDRLIRAGVRASSRKPWRDLFFDGGFDNPLSESGAGPYARALEMVRLAPSSGNTQPWRIVKRSGFPTFHFFLKKIKRAYSARGLHEVDIGIAMAHFHLVCLETNRSGSWTLSPPAVPLHFPGIEYRWTWSEREIVSE